jgi:hypothetical protein
MSEPKGVWFASRYTGLRLAQSGVAFSDGLFFLDDADPEKAAKEESLRVSRDVSGPYKSRAEAASHAGLVGRKETVEVPSKPKIVIHEPGDSRKK